MNSIEQELAGYINEAERFSGFDSYDSMDEGQSYFDNDEMSYADAAPSKAVAVSDPYIIQYQNTTGGSLTAVVFGFNDNFSSGSVIVAGSNVYQGFGNPVGITITNLQGGSYQRLLAQSNSKNFKIGRWRLQSSTVGQLQQTMSINHVDGNGKQYSIPLNLSIAKDAYQFQSDLLDVNKVVTVDGNTYITFPLLANAILTLAMFPVSILSGKAELNGGAVLNTAVAPRLSGKNVAPVIIQTSQSVTKA